MKKFSAKKRTFMCLLFIVVILSIVKFIPMLYCYYTKFYSEGKKFFSNKEVVVAEVEEVLNYNITNLIASITNTKVKINYEAEQDCVYTNFVKVSIINLDKEKNYSMEYNINGGKIKVEKLEETKENYETKINLQEGKNKVHIVIKEETDILKEEEKEIFYIKPYEKQFLDETEGNGVQVHYKRPDLEKCESDIKQLKNLGVNYVRAGFTWELVEKEKGKYDFSYYDIWMNKLQENNIKVIANIGTNSPKYVGSDKKFSSEDEIAQFMKFITAIQEHYSYIEDYEILNEPNYNSYGYLYKTEEEVKWYYKLAEEAKKTLLNKNNNLNINIGSLSIDRVETKNNISPVNFINIIKENLYKNFDKISIHPYDWFNYATPNLTLKKNMEPIKALLNDIGGFLIINATEYGATSYNKLDLNEEIQAGKLVQQSVLLDFYNMNNKIIYNFWNTGSNIEEKEENFGLLTNDYKPKLAYYTLKNHYENVNGSEYIGEVNLNEELEEHVYDKDGMPKMIVWANEKEKIVEIDYKNFTAKDIYGKEIKPNENGKLQITTSPVYIYNLDNKYYYKAISNVALQKYTEFEQKFQLEISNIPGLQQKLDLLKQYIKQIDTKTTESENIAKQKIKEHFELGNTILSEYKKGQVNIEYVKLSSMLDMLNDIGNSYEDLVTVSAKTRNPNLSETKTIINDVEKNINNNADLEIIYPQKILEFSKDLYEKAEYINKLGEENEIKTGLIVSNDLHAKYLAQWSKEFTDIYIEDYIKNNPITEKYSTKEITNQDVTVTLNILPDTKITNNKNSNIYTFTQNGEFIFEYQRRGRNFTKTVKVENIDKIAPQILNIKNDAQYTESIIPKIEEENLEKVTLTKNEKEVEYKLGEAIKEEGKYKLTVTDKAGNTSEVNFEIIKEQEDSYIIDEDKIRNIKNNTTKEDFIKKLNMSGKVKILHNDKELEPGNIISSGDILKCEDGKTYTLIVAGDINKDGKVTAYDISMLRKTILNVKELNETEKLAADVNCDDNKIGAKDYSSMKLIILGK